MADLKYAVIGAGGMGTQFGVLLQEFLHLSFHEIEIGIEIPFSSIQSKIFI